MLAGMVQTVLCWHVTRDFAHIFDATLMTRMTGPISEYCWVEGIILITVVFMSFVELMVMRYSHVFFGHRGIAMLAGMVQTVLCWHVTRDFAHIFDATLPLF
jgi:endonuclease IV